MLIHPTNRRVGVPIRPKRAAGTEVRRDMDRRPARTQTEIDLLPPFGEPEVVTTGNHAADVALAGTVGVLGLAYLSQS